MNDIQLRQIEVSPSMDVRDVLAGTMETRDYYGSIGVACSGVGAAACKDGCVNGCKDSAKSGGNCSEACKEGCKVSCRSSCQGGKK